MTKWQSVILIVVMLAGALSLSDVAAQTQASQDGNTSVRERAVEAIQFDRMSEAVPLLRVVVSERPTDVEALRMLAIALERTGDLAGARRLLTDAIDLTALTNGSRARLAFDLAGLLGRSDDQEGAVSLYTRAIRFDGALAASYLNRANTRVSLASYSEAVDDYELYLALRPTTQQRPQIEQMIAMLNDTIVAERVRQEEEAQRAREDAARRAAEEEAQRLAEEEQRRAEEEQRLVAEAARAEAQRVADERRQQMLSSVLESLGTAGRETQTFQLQNEDIRTYDEEIDILD